MSKKDTSILIGKTSGKIVLQKEEVGKFPTLESIWELVNEYTDLVEYFISADHFIFYLKDLVENKNYNLAADNVLRIIYNDIADCAWENDGESLSDNFSDDAFVEVLKNNFKFMHEQYTKSKKENK
jgi:hypothetical protein